MIAYKTTQNGNAIKISAHDGDNEVGYCEISRVLETADIINIEVQPSYRRQGIGREILTRIIEIACDCGVETITLEVRKSNVAAQSLYKSLGFSEISVREHYYPDKEDAIIMQLKCCPNGHPGNLPVADLAANPLDGLQKCL